MCVLGRGSDVLVARELLGFLERRSTQKGEGHGRMAARVGRKPRAFELHSSQAGLGDSPDRSSGHPCISITIRERAEERVSFPTDSPGGKVLSQGMQCAFGEDDESIFFVSSFPLEPENGFPILLPYILDVRPHDLDRSWSCSDHEIQKSVVSFSGKRAAVDRVQERMDLFESEWILSESLLPFRSFDTLRDVWVNLHGFGPSKEAPDSDKIGRNRRRG